MVELSEQYWQTSSARCWIRCMPSIRISSLQRCASAPAAALLFVGEADARGQVDDTLQQDFDAADGRRKSWLFARQLKPFVLLGAAASFALTDA